LELGDLKFAESKVGGDVSPAEDNFALRSSSGLSRYATDESINWQFIDSLRSKSDHRLVADFRRREEAERSPPVRRRFGESR